MKVIIAGSRDINDYELVCKAIAASGFQIDRVISGCARGVDTLGIRWATDHGKPVDRFPANWKENGRAAGIVRNGEMAKVANALIAVTNGSRGTMNMIDTAHKRGLHIYIEDVRKSV